MIIRVFQFKLFADYHQFYLRDDDTTKGSLENSWSNEAVERRLAIAPYSIGIGTVRDMYVPVLVVIHDSRPEIDFSTSDHVMEASLQIDTGRIVIAGCTDYFPEAARIEVNPGIYQALICYNSLTQVFDNGSTGNDFYEIHLFRGLSIEPRILKQFNLK